MENQIKQVLEEQKAYYNKGTTRDLKARKNILRKLKSEIEIREKDICDALYADFKKSEFESLLSETQYILGELNDAIKKIYSWAKPKAVSPSLINFPSSAKIIKEPYGTVLIIAPWNYPFQLAISPLIGAIAAGNTAVIKPSELTPNTANIISEIISAVFPENYVSVTQGDKDASTALLKERWDYIFFTGSPQVGKIVYQAAANNLTPVTLELGGKNPCIVDETAKLQQAARRIVWGKFLNGGQTCIAPDYILVASEVKDKLIAFLKEEIIAAYSDNPKNSPDYPRIVNQRNFDRLADLIDYEKVTFGGQIDRTDCYISPTLITEPSLDSDVMKEEIFGPLLPIISYNTEEEISDVISKYEKPLSLYVFSSRKNFSNKVMNQFSYGGGVINDTIVHFVNKRLPFGGVGQSGIGAYHGNLTFDVFSHHKSVVRRGTWLDIPLKYAPYEGKLNLVRKLKNFI
ncbi:aldehyde dehydrogenase [Joostella atrarenae]|uniref:Aldehyde dehydrogenase n=1 Tax=Joostella atrarenae TaxID=679257 RepID=A0ABS9J1F0_9FLAO|nr:aldehyde dehydrogenase [Joostella atrarenae]MCF8714241.1 aldehyde dehydrogenase [Joostella atrarenae]